MSEQNVVKLVSIQVPTQYTNWIFLNNKKQLIELMPALTPSAYVELCSKFRKLYETLDDSIKKKNSEQTDYGSKMECRFAGVVVPYCLWETMNLRDMESILKLALGMQLNVIIII